MKTKRLCGVLLLLVVLVSGSLYADQISWINPNDGLWDLNSNWLGREVPDLYDQANFTLDATYMVALTSEREVDGINFRQGNVTLYIAEDYSAKLTTQNCQVGRFDGDDAEVELTGGGTLDATNITIAGVEGASGTLTVSDGGVNCAERLTVGVGGTGSLLVGADGTVTANAVNAGDGGAITVSGGNMDVADMVAVGNSGSGSLLIESGGSVDVGNVVHVGWQEGSSGAVTVAGGSLECTDLRVGESGEGTFLIESGGSVNVTNSVNLGCGETSEGALTVSDGSLKCNSLVVGRSGEGNMLIESGGSVTVDNIFRVGYLGEQTSSLTVDGGELTYGSAYLSEFVIGQNTAKGFFTAKNGATVTGSNYYMVKQTYVGRDEGSEGTVLLEGEGTSWTSGDRLSVGVSGVGSFTVRDGALFSSRYASVGSEAGGEGSLLIENGGLFTTSREMTIGSSDGGKGTVTIGEGGELRVGYSIEVLENSTLILDGGTLKTNAFNSLAGDFIWNSGLLSFSSSSVLVSSSSVFKSMNLDSNRQINVHTTMFLNNGGAVSVNGGTQTFSTLDIQEAGMLSLMGGDLSCEELKIRSGGVLSKTGGTISADYLWLYGGTLSTSDGLDIDDGRLYGYGTVVGAVKGGVDSKVLTYSSSCMTLGSLATGEGYDVAGSVTVNENGDLLLLDANRAQLGITTTLNNGSTLSTINGLSLGAGETLTALGSALIRGKFYNEGTVNGSTVDGKYLTFNDDVSGAGSFSGNVKFLQGFAPGNSPAIISFNGGNVSYGASSTLEMEIFGLAENLFDRLVDIDTLSADGTLKIIFGTGYEDYDDYVPAVGDTFDLFDFVTFAGSFDDIVISGLDSSLTLDTSQLSSTGVITIVAASAQEVPEPAEAVLLLVGIALLLVCRRREIRQN